MSLVARELESRGIATVILGSALDIVEHCGVPRFLFTDFPLGNPCGRPFDLEMQRQTLSMALELLTTVQAPRTTVRSPFRFSRDQSWRQNYSRVDDSNRAELRAAGDARRARQAQGKS